ncbi:dTDP-4-dehydrorhamnose 3,5-epimerase [Methylibium petroleiphilum]|uniref:dTDP-4-dehydrorhamnose 3,5-epimerase n=1 Tax=Methylibium petroleiphilum (strain ATCC BAA-1232 / LMG 22953 / PM1) TaxID=420662 RepID=A2SDE8_METPP|nr:dTDP-4-dehydrorhamnose 3,5-epimerase [Methylibium petroleiphilum]ABM93587.1 dTDP-4-dehydrorhamnose 3,5-epimerase [Methylibium petroleiphilum PM1]
MKVSPTALPEVLLFEPDMFRDARGFVVESFNQRAFEAAVGHAANFVLDVHSRSQRGVLRGLHYQRPPHTQAKLVRVSVGSVYDVAVDLRRSSRCFGQWTGIELSAERAQQLWIPQGFAHGFLVLSESAEVQYKATNYYESHAEGAIRWDDPLIDIKWPALDIQPLLSLKDAAAPTLAQASVLFE